MDLKGLKGFSAWLVYNKIVFNLVFLRRFNAVHNEQIALIEALKTCETVEEFKEITDQLNSEKFKKVFYSQAEAVEIFKSSSRQDRETMLLEALTVSRLEDSEVMSLLTLHKDANGIEYCKANIGNIMVDKLAPMMIETLLNCSELDIDFSLLTDDENRMLEGKKITITEQAADLLANNPNISTRDLIALTVKNILTKLKGGI